MTWKQLWIRFFVVLLLVGIPLGILIDKVFCHAR